MAAELCLQVEWLDNRCVAVDTSGKRNFWTAEGAGAGESFILQGYK